MSIRFEGVSEHELPGFISGRWYTLGGYTGTSTFARDTEFVFPFYLPRGTRVDAIGARCEGGVASCAPVVAIRAGGDDGFPGDVLAQGVLDFSSTGFKSAAIDWTAPSSFVWLSFTAQGGASDPTVRHGNTPLPSPALMNNAASNPGVATVCSYSSAADRTSPGVLPASFGTMSLVVDRFPFVYLRGA